MKNQSTEFVNRISSCYVGEDCVQVMIPHYGDTISILNSDEMIYHFHPNSYLFINKYESDSRKNKFPYSQIPTHKERIRGKKIEFISQLYDFNKVYITISDGIIRENFAAKDGNEALFVTKYILPEQQKKQYLNREQLEQLYKSANGGIFCSDGCKTINFFIPSNEEILNWYKENLRKKRNNECEDNKSINNELNEYFCKCLEKMTIEDVPSGIQIGVYHILISLQENDNSKVINRITGINIEYFGPDQFLVDTYDYPITQYSLAHLRQLEQTNPLKTLEPKFSKSLNRNIDTEKIKKERQYILSLKKRKKTR